jgi:predicted site-specific integrase-resolvase
MQQDILSETIADEEIASIKGVSLFTVKRWARLGLLPPKVGPGRKPRRNRDAVRQALSGVQSVA